MTRPLLALLLTGAVAPAAPLFPQEFIPREAKVIAEEPPAGVAHAWRTKHHRFLSDMDIPPVQMQRFATTIEAVPQLLESLSLPLRSSRDDEPLKIRLCGDAETFEDLGGAVGAAGFFDGRKSHVLLRADFFLTPPPQSPRSRLAPRPNEDILVHELCHAHMARVVALAPPWIFEGLAEYFAAAHQGGGKFTFANSVSNIRHHVRRNQPLASDGTLPLPRLAHLTRLSGRSWLDERQVAGPLDTYRPYVASLLLVHYYLEGGPNRRETLAKFLTAVQKHRGWRQPRPQLVVTDPDEVEKRLRKFWSERGLQLRFTGS